VVSGVLHDVVHQRAAPTKPHTPAATGAIREFQLRLRYRFRVRSRNGIELIPDTEIFLTRDINFNETGALSKESEEALLYKDMENDLVLQLQRRLAAIRKI
jgi:LPS-assembly lipoprotein